MLLASLLISSFTYGAFTLDVQSMLIQNLGGILTYPTMSYFSFCIAGGSFILNVLTNRLKDYFEN
jgi:hypothetical protein